MTARTDLRTDDVGGRLMWLTNQVQDLRNMFIGRFTGATQGGSIPIQEADGTERARFGQLDDDSFGVIVRDGDGGQRFRVDERGLVFPRLIGSSVDPAAASKETSSASFVTMWRIIWPEAAGTAITMLFRWATQTGTAGEVRLLSNVPSNSDAFALPTFSFDFMFLSWQHQCPLGAGPLIIDVQARRTAGAGLVAIDQPAGWSDDPSLATIGGLAT